MCTVALYSYSPFHSIAAGPSCRLIPVSLAFGDSNDRIDWAASGCCIDRSFRFCQMRDVVQTEELEIPEGIEVSLKSRLITVTGPRGTLTKNVRHVDMDIRLLKGKTTKVTLAVWQGGRKHVACLRTIKSLINNMIIGVTKVQPLCRAFPSTPKSIHPLQGFQYKMRAVYAHFPINCIIQEDGRQVEIRNFLGEKVCYINHCRVCSFLMLLARLYDTSACCQASLCQNQKPKRTN